MQTGGKFIDEGLYGCVFMPTLECKTKKGQDDIDNNNLTLSKLILKDNAIIEYNVSTFIRQIPLWRNYFIVSETMCQPSTNQKEKELLECGAIKEHKLSEFRILSMPYGGVPLSSYKFNINQIDFMQFVKHIIEAGSILNLFGVVHRDIHNGNILIDSNTVPRIIDFNLAIFVEKPLTSKHIRHAYNVNIGQEPPDSTLVNGIMLGYNQEKIIDSILTKKAIIKKIRNILNISEYSMRQDLDKLCKESKSIKSGNDVQWFNTYWRTIDSWAIGVNIVDLISKLSLWPNFDTVLKKCNTVLFPVLRAMCAVNPVDRIDCVQALNYIDPNSFIIRKYSKAWITKVGSGNI